MIKVAETLGVDLPITTSLPIQKETSNEVDYKILRENEMDWKKVLLCLGYDKQLPTEEEDCRLSKQSNMGTMSRLVSIFDRTIPCVKCNRNFVAPCAYYPCNMPQYLRNTTLFTCFYYCGWCTCRPQWGIWYRLFIIIISDHYCPGEDKLLTNCPVLSIPWFSYKIIIYCTIRPK
mgnify:CR=1 FL=1